MRRVHDSGFTRPPGEPADRCPLRPSLRRSGGRAAPFGPLAAGIIILASAALPLYAQEPVAEVMLRPRASTVYLKSAPAANWRRAVQLEPLHGGDSVRVVSGSAELLFASGARTLVPQGSAIAVAVPAASARGGMLSYVGAAVRAMLDLTRGDATQRDLNRQNLEAPTRRRAVYRVAPPPANAGVAESAAAPRDDPGRARHLRLPASLVPTAVLPGTPAVRWGSPGMPAPAGHIAVRVHPALSLPGCPPYGDPLVDTVLPDPSSLPASLAGRLEPGRLYRVQVMRGAALETGCVRVASLREEADLHARMQALREEHGGGEDDDGVLAMLEAALLAHDGYHADALLRLEPLLRRPDAPETAVRLWRAISGRAGLSSEPR